MHLSVVCWRRRNYAPVSSMLLLDEGRLYASVNSMLEKGGLYTYQQYAGGGGNYIQLSIVCWRMRRLCTCQQYAGGEGTMHLSVVCQRRGRLYASVNSILEERGLYTSQQYAGGGGNYIHLSIVCWRRGDYAPVSSMLEEGVTICICQQYAGRGGTMHLSVVCWRREDYAPISSMLEEGETICICQQYAGGGGTMHLSVVYTTFSSSLHQPITVLQERTQVPTVIGWCKEEENVVYIDIYPAIVKEYLLVCRYYQL